jgi:hypothetical protein
MVVAAWLPTTRNKFRCARVLLAPSVLGDLFTSAEYLPVMKTVANQRAQQASYMSCFSRVKSACNAFLVFSLFTEECDNAAASVSVFLTTLNLLGFVRIAFLQCIRHSAYAPQICL